MARCSSWSTEWRMAARCRSRARRCSLRSPSRWAATRLPRSTLEMPTTPRPFRPPRRARPSPSIRRRPLPPTWQSARIPAFSAGLTDTGAVTFTGNLSAAGMTVDVFDTTTNKDLGDATVTGTSFSLALNLAEGSHVLRARAMLNGTYADAFFTVLVDLTPSVQPRGQLARHNPEQRQLPGFGHVQRPRRLRGCACLRSLVGGSLRLGQQRRLQPVPDPEL